MALDRGSVKVQVLRLPPPVSRLIKVSVVEDDPLVRIVAVEALLDAGFEVIEADNGPDALKHCKDAADVLFTDIQLPGPISGWDLAEQCRQCNPTMPVIYATGYSHIQPRSVTGSLRFQKPYTPEQLVSAIRSLTGRA